MKKLTVLPFFSTCLLLLTACTAQPKKTYQHIATKDLSKYSVATFAAGCFWHEEGLFESIKGVAEVVSGYAGGTSKNPTYEAIEEGNTGHAETINIYYDSSVISYPTLLKIYFAGQNPTQVNGQGNDIGTQYRSIVFYRNAAEKQQINAAIKAIQPKYKEKIAAEVKPFTKFWTAEDYHQNYMELNPDQGYVRAVCVPEARETQHQFPQLIKPDHKL